MSKCTTHHYACDCREAYFRKLAANSNLTGLELGGQLIHESLVLHNAITELNRRQLRAMAYLAKLKPKKYRTVRRANGVALEQAEVKNYWGNVVKGWHPVLEISYGYSPTGRWA